MTPLAQLIGGARMRVAPDATNRRNRTDIGKRGSAAAARLAIWRVYNEGLSRRACLVDDDLAGYSDVITYTYTIVVVIWCLVTRRGAS